MSELRPGAIKVGTDICSVSRMEASLNRFGDKLLTRVLTAGEIAYVTQNKKNTAARTAARFAAKEACAKCLGIGLRGVWFKEIEVVRLQTGEPTLKLTGRAVTRAEKLGLSHFEVSLSHEREFATAVVIGY